MSSLFQRLRDKLFPSHSARVRATKRTIERGVLIFHHTSEVIKAEEILRNAGFDIAVKGPPPEVRTGCDLAIEFPLVSQLAVVHLLSEGGFPPMEVLPLKNVLSEPVSLFHEKDFGDYLMVRAANMKITVQKSDLVIVNISGGGCPDVPFLADRLVGRRLGEGPEPKELGRTLCGYALQLAYEELRRRCAG